MEKPFVIITPESNREALRRCGVLPEKLFRKFDVNSNGLRRDDERCEGLPPVYLWPYNLRYDNVIEDGGEGLYKPDVPGFFGMDPPIDDATKRHNERLIASLLGCVMVHVVFLDDRRKERGYAEFGSFEEIVRWGQSLRKALNVRFRNEAVLQSMESVLVIVARGEQVSLRKSDVDRFNDCVRQNRNDEYVRDVSLDPEEWQRKVFQSCYFLDYNLCVRDSQELYHSAEIWDVMVGRLILAFLLSRKAKVRWWQVPGLKLWRTLDCVSEIDAKSDQRMVDEVMAKANIAVQDLVADAESLDELALLRANPDVKFPNVKGLEPEDGSSFRKIPDGGWSEYDTAACAENTCSLARWRSALEDVRRAMPGWKISYGRQADTHDAKDVFGAVHRAPGNLLKVACGIHKRIQQSSLVDDNRDPRRDWCALVAAEQEHVAAAATVKADAPKLESAQRHYVGFGVAAIIVAAVCAALGASVYYLVHTVCGLLVLKTPAWLAALFFFAFILLGSMSAALLMCFCHARAGRRGHSVLVKESENVDALMKQRDGMARRLLTNAVLMRDKLVLRSHRLRVWALLARTRDILLTELQPAVSERSSTDGSDAVKVDHDVEGRSVRETFLKRTRKFFGPYGIMMREELRVRLDKLVALWWSEHADGSHVPLSAVRNFSELWHALCSVDQVPAGYFPARLFAWQIRAFVARFTDAARRVAKESVIAENLRELRAGLLEWYEKLQVGGYYLYASGAVTGEHVNEFWMDNARVYFAESRIVDMDSFDRLRVGSQADQSRFMPECNPELGQTRLLALLFQEIPVKFCSDAEGDALGHLIFKAVSDLAEDSDV